MKTRKVIAGTLLACSVALAGTSALAADMNYPVRGTMDQTPVEFGSGWYLRGDISYTFGGLQKNGFEFDAVADSIETYDYDDSFGYSAGVGYYFGNNLRMDVTYEFLMHSEADFTGSARFRGVDTSISAYVDIAGTEQVEIKQDIDTIMANGYIDLGNFGGITPYVGAGAGLARVRYSETITETCMPAADVYCADPAGAVGEEAVSVTEESSEMAVFAYSLSAGAAIDIAPKMKLDMSYQYLAVDDGSMFGGTKSNFEGVDIHRARVGLRYDIW